MGSRNIKQKEKEPNLCSIFFVSDLSMHYVKILKPNDYNTIKTLQKSA